MPTAPAPTRCGTDVSGVARRPAPFGAARAAELRARVHGYQDRVALARLRLVDALVAGSGC